MAQDNIIPFRTKAGDAVVGVPAPLAQVEETQQQSHGWIVRTLLAAGASFGAVIRYTVFLVLLWLRAPIRFILGFISIPLLLIAPVIYLGMSPGEQKTHSLWAAIGFGFGAFTLRWFYDVLLTRISPEPLILD